MFPAALLVLLCALFLVAGIGAWLAVFIGWRRVGPYYRELWAKLVIEVARFASVAAIVAPKFTGSEGALWALAQVLAGGSLLAWSAASLVGESRLRGQAGGGRLREVLRFTLQKAVNAKTQRIVGVLAAPPGTLIGRARSALNPSVHTALLLEHLSVFLMHVSPPAIPANQTFWVTLYVYDPLAPLGLLEPCYAYNSSTLSPASPTSHLLGPLPNPAFQRGGPGAKAEVVNCANQPPGNNLLLIPDCSTQPGGCISVAPAFSLQSLIAYRIDSFRWHGTMQAAVVVADTNVPGYFRAADREELRACMEEFAARLSLESFIREL